MGTYDAKQHSKDRLGAAGIIPAVPMMPTEAQISCQTGMMHLRLMGTAYVRVGLPSIHPAQYQGVVKAIKAQPQEPSWSGSPSPYYHLDVEPAGEAFCILKAGGVTIGRVAVFDGADIVSPDQIHEAMDQTEDPIPLDSPASPHDPPTDTTGV
jgi:hypothetical protein